MLITEAEWDRMATIFKQILDRYAVPAAEQQELFAIVGSTKSDIVMAPDEYGTFPFSSSGELPKLAGRAFDFAASRDAHRGEEAA